MIEANDETLKEILLNRGVITKTSNTALLNENKGVSASSLMPKLNTQSESININAGTNFIKDITELIKSTTDLLNTDLGKLFINKLTNKSEVENKEIYLNNSPVIPYEQDLNKNHVNFEELNKNEVNVKMENDKEYERRAEEIVMFSIYLLENVVNNKQDIKGVEILEELKKNKEESVKVLKEVFKENDKKN